MRPTIAGLLVSALLAPFSVLLCRSHAAVLAADALWQGEVSLSEDLLVPPGITLTIAPGTRIRVARAESSKTDPEYLSPLVELTVRGTLVAEGEPPAPIVFSAADEPKPGSWAGLFVSGGAASLRHCRIEDAETGVYLLGGRLRLSDTTLRANRYGIVLQPEGGTAQGGRNHVTENDYGLVAVGEPPAAVFAEIGRNRKRDVLRLPERAGAAAEPSLPAAALVEQPVSRSYGDEALTGETVWRGRIEVRGQVRVPEGSRLVIVPGTVVEFTPRDTNGDGIGENGLLVQGVIVAKGASTAPILFRSAAGTREGGGWDAVNIMNSAGAWNLFEHCRFEHAYRGLHFHFSRAAITHSDFVGNLRGVQFQESIVRLHANRFVGNRSAIQGRDSEVSFTENTVARNWQGANFFRVHLSARANRILANEKEGMRIREGTTVFEQNLVDANRYGLLVMDSFYGSFRGNSISNNGETGFSLKNTDQLEISENFIGGNGLYGMNVQDTGGSISRNLFSENRERGLGIQSFGGVLEENNFNGNGLYAVDVDGPGEVSAPRNWWGGDSPEQAIFDKKDDPTKGAVAYEAPAENPFLFSWPLPAVDSPVTLAGDVAVNRRTSVAPGATLKIVPGARIFFADGAGLSVGGRLVAQGEPARRILFSSLGKREPGAWDEIHLENANGSALSHCVIEYATWGLHSHFSQLTVRDATIRRNYGGLRFRSGPVVVEGSLFAQNSIGVRAYRGNAVVRGSTITGNEIGVFVREKGAGLTLTGNNIFENSSYNLRIGDFNDEDVAAAENWWGEGDPLATIFDGRSEPGIGMARIEPFARAPLPLPVPVGSEE